MVVDPNDFKELPSGEVGEILTRGPQVFKGYWNNPEATRNAFVELDGKQLVPHRRPGLRR
jgi:fatty-acyl-CoA synthase